MTLARRKMSPRLVPQRRPLFLRSVLSLRSSLPFPLSLLSTTISVFRSHLISSSNLTSIYPEFRRPFSPAGLMTRLRLQLFAHSHRPRNRILFGPTTRSLLLISRKNASMRTRSVPLRFSPLSLAFYLENSVPYPSLHPQVSTRPLRPLQRNPALPLKSAIRNSLRAKPAFV